MESSSCLSEPARSIQLLTPPKSPSAIDLPPVVNDVQVVACSPLRASPSIPHSQSLHSLVEHSDPRSIASLTDHGHARKRKADSIEPQVVRTKKRCVPSEQDEFVCEACCQIDFRKVVDLDAATLQMNKNRGGVFIASLGKLCDQASGSNCALCRIFSAVRIPADPHPKTQEYQLRAFSLQMNSHFIQGGNCPKRIREHDQPYLAVVPKISHHRSPSFAAAIKKAVQLFCYQDGSKQKEIFAPQAVPSQVNYSRVVQWLKYCRSYHKRLCTSEKPVLAGLKLLDCSSLSVIAAPPSCPYAALSYVWGGSKGGSCDGVTIFTGGAKVLRPRLSNVVLDAIQVTKALGLQYLWVDKFCIDQDNPTEKHDQISQMDVIYRGAEITIIAAAGEDENYGLPGVGNRHRRAQPVAKIGNIRVVSSMAHPHRTITGSRWWTRAWTYQEAVLSRRRLVFTEDQIYFECNAMNCSESLQGALDVLHKIDRSQSLSFMHSGVLSSNDFESFGNRDDVYNFSWCKWRTYLDLASQYTAKDLSFEEDSLKAFAGIMRHLMSSPFSICQIWGVPYDRGRYESILEGLLWSHKRPCWSTLGKPRRRSGFPSWSWAGWAGEIEFTRIDCSYLRFGRVANVYLEVEAGCLVELDYLPIYPAEDLFQFSYPLALHLDTWTFPANILKVKDPSTPSACTIADIDAILSLSEGPADPIIVSKMLCEGKWELLWLGTPYLGTSFLVVENHTDFACRVGTVKVHDLWVEDHPSVNSLKRRRRVCLK